MALVKPTARTKAAFDATKDEVFYFNVDSGDLVTKNKITIVNQSNNQVVYTNTTPDSYFAHTHTVPKNTLSNGNYYYYYINTFNANGDMSVNSNSVPFYCYTEPVLTVTNLPESSEYIDSTNYVFNITYSQAEGELMDYLVATIYDSNNNEYIVGDKIYANSDNSYDFAVVGMPNGVYSISVTAITVNNTEVILDKQSFRVQGTQPTVYAKLKLTNDCDRGYIEVESNITNIEGDTGDYEPEFIDDEKIYLLPRQRYCRWMDNFKVPSNFTMGIWGQIGENYHHKDIIMGHTRLYNPLYTHNNTRLAVLYPQEWVEWNGIILQNNFSLGFWGSLGEILSETPIEIFRTYNTNGDRMIISAKREIPEGDTLVRDCFIMDIFAKDGTRMCHGRTNYVEMMQPTDDYYMFISKQGLVWTLKLIKETNNSHQFNFNEVGVVQYGQSLTLGWNNNTDYYQNDGEQLYYNNVESMFPFTSCRLKNGNYEHLHLVNSVYNYDEFSKSTYPNTVLNCSFNGNLEGQVGFKSEIFRMWNDDNYGMVLNVICEIPHGESNPKHCYELSFYDGNTLIGWGRTNYTTLLNPQDDYALFVQRKDGEWTLGLTNKTQETFSFNWNVASSNRFGQTMSALQWDNNTEYSLGNTEPNNFTSVLDSMFPMTHVQISNGIYDGIDISENVERTQTDYLTYIDWDYDTVLNCDFNGNINGGNIEGIFAHLYGLRLKRKASNSNKWITIKEISVDENNTSFTYLDHYVPSGISQQYAIVPIAWDKTEGEYLIEEITPKWRQFFFTINNESMPMYANVKYGSVTNNRKYGILEPIQSQYPVVIKNSLTAYLSGSISSKFLGANYYKTRTVNRLEVVQQIQRAQKMLDTGGTICLKDPNGWILLCKPTSGDTATFDSNYGNGVADISFNWVEVGKYDNQDDLYNLGIIDVNV